MHRTPWAYLWCAPFDAHPAVPPVDLSLVLCAVSAEAAADATLRRCAVPSPLLSMGTAASLPAAAPSVVSGAAAATTAVKGQHRQQHTERSDSTQRCARTGGSDSDKRTLTLELCSSRGVYVVCMLCAAAGHAHHDSPVIPRMAPSVSAALLVIVAVTILGALRAIPVTAHMLLITVATIYVGSRFALKCWKIEGGSEDAPMQGAEQMQTKDAMMFPLIGSATLFTLYLVYKFLPAGWINVFIKAYFFIFGCIVLAQKLSQILAATLPLSLVHTLLAREYSIPNPMWLGAKFEEGMMPVLKLIPYLGYNTPAAPPAPAAGAAAGAAAAAPAPAADAPAQFWMPLSVLDLSALGLALGVSALYIVTNSWICSNAFGVAFSVQGIEMLSLGSYLNGCILLCGLFVYDVFCKFVCCARTSGLRVRRIPRGASTHAIGTICCVFSHCSFSLLSLLSAFSSFLGVFGTDVMVTVAKSFEAPIKLLFPQMGWELDKDGQLGKSSMLGLGDIVIPGIFIALLLRYDLWRNIQRLHAANTKSAKKISKDVTHAIDCLYCHVDPVASKAAGIAADLSTFHMNLVAYALSLATTIGVMYTFQAAQPALLYMVPGCLGASVIQAGIRGDLGSLWKYTENEDEKAAEKKKKEEAAVAAAGVVAASGDDSAASASPSARKSSRARSGSDAAGAEEETAAAEPASPASGAAMRAPRKTSSKKKRSARAD